MELSRRERGDTHLSDGAFREKGDAIRRIPPMDLCRLAAATQPPPADGRNETFAVEDGALVRRVVPAKGKAYEHRCPQEAFEAVAATIDEIGQDAFVLEDKRSRADRALRRNANR